jgi:hypothetical protein
MSDHMNVERIRFERTGGFAGMQLSAELELDDLSEDQIKSLTGLLDDLDFPELPELFSSGPAASDEFTYTITVESQTWKHTVVTGDNAPDEKMQELLLLLNRLLRKQLKK